MKDYRVEVKVRNNPLYQTILRRGMSVAELGTAAKCSINAIYRLLSLKDVPQTSDGDWKPFVIRMADVLRTMPADLFPPQHLRDALPQSDGVVEVGFDEIGAFIDGPNDRLALPSAGLETTDRAELIDRALSTLQPIISRVLRMRFGLDGEPMTLDAIAAELNVTKERIRQMEYKGLRILKSNNKTITKELLTALRDFG